MHLVAGEHDGVIPASNIRYHHAAMSSAGMDVSYREFDYGHMDFTFSAKVKRVGTKGREKSKIRLV